MLSPYSNKPKRLLTQLGFDDTSIPLNASYCAGFEFKAWRCDSLADHLIEWIADYALKEEELRVDHSNMYIRLKEAAVRVYSSNNYKSRGEIGEIILHIICREFFDTVPFAPRVFYLTSSNDVVKSFDLVHVRDLPDDRFELWLGEAKFYQSAIEGIKAAIESVMTHIDRGFLRNEKLILGPQVSRSLPHYQEIRDLLSVQASLDKLFENAVFPICIACDSKATQANETIDEVYVESVGAEISVLIDRLRESGLTEKIKIMLIYVPLASKQKLAKAFDDRLKGLCP